MSTDVLGTYNFAETPAVNGTLLALDNGEIVLTALVSADPVYPLNGTVKLFGRTLASRDMAAFVGNSGMAVTIQPAVWRQKVARWNPPGNATTAPGVDGLSALVTVGTATTRTVATTNLFTRTKRLGYVANNAAGSLCGQYSNTAQFTTGNGAGLGGIFYSCRFGFSDTTTVTGTRSFVGLTSSTAAPTNVDPATIINCIGVAQLSASATQLYIVYGGSAAQTAIPLGTNFPPMTAAGATNGIAYDFTVFAPPNSNGVINYRLERIGTSFVAEGTLTPTTVGTQTPASTTLLAHRAWRTNNVTAGVVAIDILGVYIETDY